MFQVPSYIQNIRTLVDGSLKLDVITQELSGEEKTKIFNLHKKQGWFVFKEKAIEKEDLIDLPDFQPEFKGDKTPGQRLRAVMYILWEQNGSIGDSDTFYRNEMERIITRYKEKLN